LAAAGGRPGAAHLSFLLESFGLGCNTKRCLGFELGIERFWAESHELVHWSTP
jgi:hypothetical protein